MANDLIRVPFGDDGLPLSITPPVGYAKTSDHLGGYVHNGSEVTIVQTDADETIFGGVNFYTADEITWDNKSYADIQAHPNGGLNLWIKQVSINGVCHVKELVQYDVTKVFTAAESLQNLRWAGSSGCGAVAAYVLAGYVDIGYVL